jgi:hypothetical protein
MLNRASSCLLDTTVRSINRLSSHLGRPKGAPSPLSSSRNRRHNPRVTFAPLAHHVADGRSAPGSHRTTHAAPTRPPSETSAASRDRPPSRRSRSASPSASSEYSVSLGGEEPVFRGRKRGRSWDAACFSSQSCTSTERPSAPMLCCRAEFACSRCGCAGFWVSVASHVDGAQPASQSDEPLQIDRVEGVPTFTVDSDLRRVVEAAGIAPAAPIYEVVLTIASVEPLVSDLFWVTLTPAVAGVSCARRSDDTDARREARRCFGRSDRSAQRGRVRDSQILRGRTDAAGSFVGRLPCEDRGLLARGAPQVRRMAYASGYGVHRPGGADRRETALPAPTLPAGRGGSPRGGQQPLAAETALDALDRGAWADGGASTLSLVRGFDRAIQAAKRRIALSCTAAALREGNWGVCRGEPSVR